MPRLSPRAYDILAAEIRRLAPDPLEKVRADIVLRRLLRFREAEGPPLSRDELRDAVVDIFPDFSEAVLRRAAQANGRARLGRRLGCAGAAAVGLAAAAGGLWLINLPYPMIRWPVARTAPILLLPSYLRMDHSYRQAISLVEQADQLVNRATGPQDLELGAEKTDQAQTHLDRLPVWFLGYYPQTYCQLFSCTWRFTYDEFAAARRLVGRTEAVIFQEQNAQTLLQEATAAAEAAKAAHQSAETATAQAAAAADWQIAIDQLREIPSETLAGRTAATRLTAYERDYQQVVGLLAGDSRTNALITAAKSFAYQAAVEAQNPPHPATTWERIAQLWRQAIERLQGVPVEDPGYALAQERLAEYQRNLGIVEEWIRKEQAAEAALGNAQDKTARLLGQNLDAMAPNQIASQLQQIVNDLEQVPGGTTASAEAEEMLRSAVEKLNQLNP